LVERNQPRVLNAVDDICGDPIDPIGNPTFRAVFFM
jgi:hypothetical protein